MQNLITTTTTRACHDYILAKADDTETSVSHTSAMTKWYITQNVWCGSVRLSTILAQEILNISPTRETSFKLHLLLHTSPEITRTDSGVPKHFHTSQALRQWRELLEKFVQTSYFWKSRTALQSYPKIGSCFLKHPETSPLFWHTAGTLAQSPYCTKLLTQNFTAFQNGSRATGRIVSITDFLHSCFHYDTGSSHGPTLLAATVEVGNEYFTTRYAIWRYCQW